MDRENNDATLGQEVAKEKEKQFAGGLTVPNNPYGPERGGILVTYTIQNV